MKQQNNTSKIRVLLIREDVGGVEQFAVPFEAKEMDVSVVPVVDGRIPVTFYNTYDVILFAYTPSVASLIIDFLNELKTDIVSSMIPVVVFSQNETCGQITYLLEGAEAVISDYRHAGELADYVDNLVRKKTFEKTDPVTGLLTGAALSAILEDKCKNCPKSWHFVIVKILNMKPFNYIKGYDYGDRVLRDLAGIIRENLRINGEQDDLAARIGGSCFCIVTETRKIDTICRSLLVNSDKMIRRHYSPFELMKGYVTVEGAKQSQEFNLCEVIAGAAQVPAQWNDNHAMLLDIASDLIKEVEKQEAGYHVISL